MAFMLPSTIQFKFWTLSDFKEIKIRWFTYHLHCATVILILMNLTPLLSQTIGSLKQHSSTLHDYAYNFTCFTLRDFNLDNGHSWLGDKLHHTTLDFILELPFTKQDKQSLTRQLLPTIYYPKMLWRNEVIAPGHILFKDVVTKWSNYSRPYSNYWTWVFDMPGACVASKFGTTTNIIIIFVGILLAYIFTFFTIVFWSS